MVTTASRPRILHVFVDPATGVKLVAGLARAASDAGYEVEFACNLGEMSGQLASLGLPVYPVPLTRQFASLQHVSAFLVLRRLMCQRRYAIVHTHTPIASFVARAAARSAGVPAVVYHMRGSAWEHSSRLARVLFTALERIARPWTDAVLTVNCDDASDVIAKGIAAASAVECLHCGASGLSSDWFTLPDDARVSARRELGFAETDVVVGFVGRLVREKGVFELLEALEPLAAELAALQLLIVGGALASDRDRGAEGELKRAVEASDVLRHRVRFAGFRHDVRALVAATEIMVQPSHREGFANVLAEAGAVGRPVVGANTRGVREVVVHGETGLIVPVKDIERLRLAIRELAIDPVKRAKMGSAGRARAECFRAHVAATKVLRWYGHLLQHASTTPLTASTLSA